MSILSIIVDSREPPSIRNLAFGGVPVAVAPLDAGDVMVATDDAALLVIERKTPNDLLGSIADNRLFNQAAAMKALSQFAYVVVDGTMTWDRDNKVRTDRETGWNWDAVQGALLTMQELGVSVIHSENFESTVIWLANRGRDRVVIKPVRLPHVLSNGESVIAALPGIGPERTSALLDYCATPANAIYFLTDLDQRERVPGIGWNTKVRVRQALGLKPFEYMAVLTNGKELEHVGK